MKCPNTQLQWQLKQNSTPTDYVYLYINERNGQEEEVKPQAPTVGLANKSFY
jgi:hypothetical protein